MRRIFFLFYCLTVGFGAISVFAQKDIKLYETHFTDWGALNNDESSEEVQATAAGAGFSLLGKPKVEPAGVACASTGRVWFDNGSGFFKTKPFTFVSGGALEVWLCQESTSSKNLTLTASPAFSGVVQAAVLEAPSLNPNNQSYMDVWAGTSANNVAKGTSSADKLILDPAKYSVFGAGNQIQMRGNIKGLYKYIFYFPTTVNESKALQLSINKEFSIVYMAVYSGVGTTPYVASSNYSKAPAAGHSLTGTVGGAANSGTPANNLIKVKAWNISGNVTLSIVGTDASKFSLPTTTVSNADALAGKDVIVNFSPSVREGLASAQLKIEAAGCQPYYVSLTGITGGGTTPKILASSATVPFYTSVIAPVTKTVSFAGVNLTADVIVKIEGDGKERYSLSETNVSKDNAMAGRTLSITYTGDIEASERNAFLVLSSTGATDVKIPLFAVTRDSKPQLFDLTFEVVPSGSAFIDYSLAGPTYEAGQLVTVTITPETGYLLDYWSDNAANNSLTRTFRVSANRSYKIFMMVDNGTPPPVSNFVAYTPSSITDDGFVAQWSSVSGATGYTVVVYNKSKTEVQRIPVSAGNQVAITGLKPLSPASAEDFNFYYEVEAATSTGIQRTNQVGVFKITGLAPFACGN